MNGEKLISVIIPVYNVEDYLPRCLDSILAQTWQNLEIILVDDGTRDSAGQICDDYAQKDSRIRVLHKENGGLSSARNAGLDMATGDYLSFIDSDDWIHPDTYTHLMRLMESCDAQLACMGNYNVYEKTGKQSLSLCPKKEECITAEELVRRMFLWDGIDCAACDKVFKRELFDGIRFPMGVVCEDIAIMYRVVLRAERAAMCDQPYYYYFQHGGSISNSAVSDRTFHYSEHAGRILREVQKEYPQMEKPAKNLRVRSIVYNVQKLDLASAEDREKYRDIYRESRKELRRNIGFMCTSGYFTGKEILRNALMSVGAYRMLRAVYHLGR